MDHSTLDQLLAARGAVSGEYHGTPSARSYGDVDGEYAALRGGAALLDFRHRAALVAEGSERTSFLHGQLTGDVRALVVGRGAPAMTLTPQGRPLAMFTLVDLGSRMLLSVDRAALTAARASLERFLVADDVEFLDTGSNARIAVAGPSAAAALAAAGCDAATTMPAWAAADATIGGQPVTVLSRGDLDIPFFEVVVGAIVGEAVDDEDDDDDDWEDDGEAAADDGGGDVDAAGAVRLGHAGVEQPPADAAPVWRALEEAGARPAGFDAFEAVRVESGAAEIGVDIDESRVVLEARLEWAIHFAKGCYVGQEIVERVVSRGGLNRQLALVRLSAPIASGAVRVGGGASETLASVVRSPRHGTLGFVYLPADGFAEGDRFKLAGDSTAGVEGEAEAEVEAEVLAWPRARRLAGRA